VLNKLNIAAVVQTDISGHLPVLIDMRLKIMLKKIYDHVAENNIQNIEQFAIELNHYLQNYDKDKTVDLDFLLQTMNELTEKYFSKMQQSRKRYKYSKRPWVTKEFLKLMRYTNFFQSF